MAPFRWSLRGTGSCSLRAPTRAEVRVATTRAGLQKNQPVGTAVEGGGCLRADCGPRPGDRRRDHDSAGDRTGRAGAPMDEVTGRLHGTHAVPDDYVFSRRSERPEVRRWRRSCRRGGSDHTSEGGWGEGACISDRALAGGFPRLDLEQSPRLLDALLARGAHVQDRPAFWRAVGTPEMDPDLLGRRPSVASRRRGQSDLRAGSGTSDAAPAGPGP